MDEIFVRLDRTKIFIKLNIRQIFYYIYINPDSEELTTFRTRYKSYKYKILFFDFTNSLAIYQRYINNVLFDYFDDFYTAYLDDILIYSDNIFEYEVQMKKVLQRLRKTDLQTDINKYEFNITSIKYLDFIISTDGIRTDPEKIIIIKK
jgi:hypothetical protein